MATSKLAKGHTTITTTGAPTAKPTARAPTSDKPHCHRWHCLQLLCDSCSSKIKVAKSRLCKEFIDLQKEEEIGGGPRRDNIFVWDTYIQGPMDTPWEGGKFKLTFEFAKNHPFKPPKVRFVSPIFHPNVSPSTGIVYLDILDDQWSPAFSVISVLVSIQSVLNSPDVVICINRKAAEMYSKNRKEYNKKVQCISALTAALEGKKNGA